MSDTTRNDAPSAPSTLPDESLAVLIGRVDGKVDLVIQQLSKMDTRHENLEGRVRSLERWRAYMMGAAAVTGAASSKLVGWITGGT